MRTLLKPRRCTGNTCKNKPKTVRCRRCLQEFPNRHEMYLHIREQHIQRGRGDTEVVVNIEDQRLRNFYDKYRSFICDQHEIGQPELFYNFPVPTDLSCEDMRQHLDFIYENQQQSFKINLSFGFVLQHVDTEELRYFRAYSNDTILDVSFTVSTREDLEFLIQRLSEIDIMSEVTKNRPNIKWRLVLLTNVRYYVVSMTYPVVM